jgi:hypothetical protein
MIVYRWYFFISEQCMASRRKEGVYSDCKTVVNDFFFQVTKVCHGRKKIQIKSYLSSISAVRRFSCGNKYIEDNHCLQCWGAIIGEYPVYTIGQNF